jgi:microcystin-dependent protein
MAEGYLGQIILFAGSFAPRNWALCNGQILSIAQNTALFSILGTTYGGDGQTTFALPDLRGRAPISPNWSSHALGEVGGSETVTLSVNHMPTHTHTATAYSQGGNTTTPANGAWAASTSRDSIYATTGDTTMSSQAVEVTGGSQPHDNMQPYLGLNYIICVMGLFPSRN